MLKQYKEYFKRRQDVIKFWGNNPLLTGEINMHSPYFHLHSLVNMEICNGYRHYEEILSKYLLDMGVRYIEDDKLDDEKKPITEDIENAISQWFSGTAQQKQKYIPILQEYVKDRVKLTPIVTNITKDIVNQVGDINTDEVVSEANNNDEVVSEVVSEANNNEVSDINADDVVAEANNNDGVVIEANNNEVSDINTDGVVIEANNNEVSDINTDDVVAEANNNDGVVIEANNNEVSDINNVNNNHVLKILKEQEDIEKSNLNRKEKYNKQNIERVYKVYDFDDVFFKEALNLIKWHKPVTLYYDVYKYKYDSVEYNNSKVLKLAQLRGSISNNYSYEPERLKDIDVIMDANICELALTIITLMGCNETINPFKYPIIKAQITQQAINLIRDDEKTRSLISTAFKEGSKMDITYYQLENYAAIINNILNKAFGWKYIKKDGTITSPFNIIEINGQAKVVPRVGIYKFFEDESSIIDGVIDDNNDNSVIDYINNSHRPVINNNNSHHPVINNNSHRPGINNNNSHQVINNSNSQVINNNNTNRQVINNSNRQVLSIKTKLRLNIQPSNKLNIQNEYTLNERGSIEFS
jgi:hypothetical protein